MAASSVCEPAPLDIQEAVREITAKQGVRRACALLRVAPATLARVGAGFPVTRAIVTHIRVHLANSGGEP